MKYITYIISAICLISCSKEIDYEALADKTTAETAQKLKKENKLTLIGSSGGMMGDIQLMGMSFHFFHKVDLKEARKLLVDVIQEYLNGINSDKEIRPYLHNYPFTAENLEIMIWIRNSNGTRISIENIYCMAAIEGILTYYLIDDPLRDIDKEVCRETYEEALEKLQESHQNLILNQPNS